MVLFRDVSYPCDALWPEQSQHQQTRFHPTHLEQSGLLSSELAIPFEDNHRMEWMPFELAQTNGYGNGDQEAPGGSGGNNNAENALIPQPMGMTSLDPVDAFSLMVTGSDPFESTYVVSDPLA